MPTSTAAATRHLERRILMFRADRFRLAVAITAGAALLAGCSDSKECAAAKLPASTCFGAFSPTELEPFELQLWIDGSAEETKPDERRPLFSELIKKYLEFAKQQNQCG
ncbi:hypothetical protein [Streptomyces sp. NPDC054797]